MNSDISDLYRRAYGEINTGQDGDENWDNPDRIGNSNFALIGYSRSPVRKADLARNLSLESISKQMNADSQVVGYQINAVSYVTTTIDLTILCDNVALMDAVELLLLNKISDRAYSIEVKYKLGHDVEPIEVDYNVVTQSADGLKGIQNSNMRSINIRADITGLVFVPFYQSRPVMEEVELEIWVFDKLVDPIVENTELGTLAVTLYPPHDKKE